MATSAFFDHGFENAFHGEQIFRRIKLSDVPRVKDEDAIVVHDGVQSVRDGQNRGIAKIFTYPEEEDILSAV